MVCWKSLINCVIPEMRGGVRLIFCTTSNISEAHCERIRSSSGKEIWTPLHSDALDRSKVSILISYGNYNDIITDEQLEGLPNLRWIQLLSAGYDTLPLGKLSERGVLLTSASGVHAKPIGEYVLSSILYFYKQLPLYMEHKRERIWDGSRTSEELEDRTIGILGTGHIGSEIARKCKALGMRAIGLNTDGRAVSPFDRTASYEELETVLAASDIVCSVLPSTPATVGFMNARRFASMKDGAIFINVGRGDLVVEDDLLDAMKRGKFKGVALDVFREEPLPADHPFWRMNDLILTPHVSSKSDRYIDRCLDLFLHNLPLFEAGQFDRMQNRIALPAVKQGSIYSRKGESR